MESNKIKIVNKYIAKCQALYDSYNDLEKKELIDEIISVFQHSIVDLTQGLTVYQINRTVNLDKDLIKIQSRLEWFKNVLKDGETNNSNNADNIHSLDSNGNITISNSELDDATIHLLFKDVRKDISIMTSENDLNDANKIVDEVEKVYKMDLPKKEAWTLLKPILAETATKRITVATPVLKVINAVVSMI